MGHVTSDDYVTWLHCWLCHVTAVMDVSRDCRTGCGMAEIWDIEDAANQHQQPVCERLAYQPEPYFRRVFRNHQYDVLQVVQTPPGEQ